MSSVVAVRNGASCILASTRSVPGAQSNPIKTTAVFPSLSSCTAIVGFAAPKAKNALGPLQLCKSWDDSTSMRPRQRRATSPPG